MAERGPGQRGPGQRGPWTWHAAVLVAASLPVLFYGLGSYSLVNGDEGFYHDVARRMLRSGNWFRVEFDGEHRVYETFLNAPLQYWARALVIAVLGDGYWSMRILSALCGLAAVLATYRLTLAVAGRTAGLVAGLLLLTTVQFVYLHSARTGESETIVAFFYVAAAYLLLRAVRAGKSLVPHFLCLAVLTSVKLPFVVVPLLADVAFVCVEPAARRRLRDGLLAGLLVLPLPLLWHVGQALALGDEFRETMGIMAGRASDADRLDALLDNAVFYARTVLFGAFPAVLAYPFALWGLLRAGPDPAAADGRKLIASYAGAVFVFFVLVAKHYPWYVIPAYPFLSAATALWLVRSWHRAVRAPFLLAVALILTAFVWIRVDVRDFNPFEARVLSVSGDASWREISGIPLGVGPAITLALLVGLLAALRRRVGRGIAGVLAVGMLAFAGVRTVYPLACTDYESDLARLHDDLAAARTRGRPLDYPVPVRSRATLKVRYFFGRDYEIERVVVPWGRGVFFYLRE